MQRLIYQHYFKRHILQHLQQQHQQVYSALRERVRRFQHISNRVIMRMLRECFMQWRLLSLSVAVPPPLAPAVIAPLLPLPAGAGAPAPLPIIRQIRFNPQQILDLLGAAYVYPPVYNDILHKASDEINFVNNMLQYYIDSIGFFSNRHHHDEIIEILELHLSDPIAVIRVLLDKILYVKKNKIKVDGTLWEIISFIVEKLQNYYSQHI